MSSKPTLIRFHLEHSDDEEITCFFCTLPRCDQSFTCAGWGGKKTVGVHNACADKHMDKMTTTGGVG